MRDPAAPEAPETPKTPENEGPSGSSGIPGVSIPDRRRIDSDVRAFLREPSTPWIVFDQEGRPPSQLAVGEVLKGPRRTLLSDYDFFPSTAAVDQTPQPLPLRMMEQPSTLEPSSLSVASDLRAASDAAASSQIYPPATTDVAAVEDALPDFSAAPIFGVSRRILGASAAGVALLSLLVVGGLALRSVSSSSNDGAAFRNAAIAQPAARAAAGAPVPADIPPPDLDVKAPAPAVNADRVVAPEPTIVAPAAPAPVMIPTPLAVAAPAPAVSAAPAGLPVAVTIIPPKNGVNKYTRFTITGDARAKDVYLDAKRMLGRGTRSFSVLCGAHTISINVRNEPHDVDFPCGAELIVGK